MNTAILAVASNRDSLVHAHKWFTRTDPTIIYQILGVILLLSSALALTWAIGRFQQWRLEPARRQPMALYIRLMRKLQLPLTDRWRMCQLAITLGLKHPTVLLVSRDHFDAAVERYHKRRPLSNMTAFQAVRTRLFPPDSP